MMAGKKRHAEIHVRYALRRSGKKPNEYELVDFIEEFLSRFPGIEVYAIYTGDTREEDKNLDAFWENHYAGNS